jgi:RNA-directed DNA polymerase
MALDLLSWLGEPLSQEDHFGAGHLEALFQTKIAKSQATGKDGVRIGRFQEHLVAEAAFIERKVREKAYRFTTFKERLILRGADREPRQISIPTVRDRLTLRALCQVLHTFAPKTVGSTPHALVDRIVKAIRSTDQSSNSFVRVDVKNFFPSISHPILAREIRHYSFNDTISELCMRAVVTPTGGTHSPNERGVPQGLSISGALSALYMLRFDKAQLKKNANYFRYVDDILLICESKKADDNLKAIGRSLSSRGLIIHKKGVAGKTEIKPVVGGVDFLGYRISIEAISIRDSSYRRMFKNILKVITDYRYKHDAGKLLFRLNLKITGCIVDNRRRGWMMFFSHTEDMKQLAHLDAFVIQQLSRINFPKDQLSRIKRFIKSYHEIRFNINSTVYIPNLDNFDQNDKINAIVSLSSKTSEEVSAWDIQSIDQEFSRLISREVHDLEQDVGNPS